MAAWVFYGLTSHPKNSSFERVVQALIFTALIQAVVIPLGAICLWVGNWWSIGVWDQNSQFVCAVSFAIILGHFLAWGANSNWYHNLLSRFDITSRTSRPSQWFSAFHSRKRFVVLHLTNGRRLQGWPNEWPDDPKEGHFLIEEPAWILDDNSIQSVLTDDVIVIKGSDVEMVEFLRYQNEVVEYEEEILVVEQKLIVENKKDEDERTESKQVESIEVD